MNQKGKVVKKENSSNKRKAKQATQRTAMQRIAIMGPTGKLRMEWRPW